MRPILLPRPDEMTWEHVYRGLAANDDIHAITQRPDAAKTDLIMAIASSRLPASDAILDIGCGDGRLLHSLQAGVRVGTVISEEEARRLRRHYVGAGIEFMAQDVTKLEMMGRTFGLVCAIGVFQHLGTAKAVRRALEAARQATAIGGHLYVGVLPQTGATPKRHRSTLRAIGFVWRTSGTAKTVGFLWHLWRRRHRLGYYEAPRLPQYAARADAFITLAAECGFELQHQWSCADFGVDDDRQRMDYLFKRSA